MNITVDLYDAKPVYQQITDAVRDAIALGALQAGDRLPPIRETAVQTRVNRNTVSRAYLQLEHLGLVQARQGSGYFVTQRGAEQERRARRQIVCDLVDQLITQARLSQISIEELLNLVRVTAIEDSKQAGANSHE